MLYLKKRQPPKKAEIITIDETLKFGFGSMCILYQDKITGALGAAGWSR